jgi:predicted RNase H-like nuclease (RuvC/YqgF family)
LHFQLQRAEAINRKIEEELRKTREDNDEMQRHIRGLSLKLDEKSTHCQQLAENIGGLGDHVCLFS